VSNTLWARLEPNGRLVVGAVAKKQPPRPQSTVSTTGTEAAPSTAAGSEVNDRNDDALIDAETTSLPQEAGASQYPDILITCPGAVGNSCCSSPDKE